jgi:methylenetetrahydrofolate--tRNA-(uracil-5-)-methyltransferase
MFPLVIATGPLTSDALSADIAALVGGDHLYFYDAVSPIVLADSIDYDVVFRASRWGRSLRGAADRAGGPEGPPLQTSPADGPACGVDDGEGDYLNCPLTREQYEAFYAALTTAESATVHDFEKERFFEGCLPVEVIGSRGPDTLRFGPMKPVGLADPRTGRRPFAVVQLRQDDLAATHFSMVGFQTQLKWSEQKRVFRLIPGLQNAEFVRFGMIHRNTYVNAPRTLEPTFETRRRPGLFFAGQMSGVEGYVESAASGLLAAIGASFRVRGEAPLAFPEDTAMGALGRYIARSDPANYQPTNIAFGLLPELAARVKDKAQRRMALSHRALESLDRFRPRLGDGPSRPQRVATTG